MKKKKEASPKEYMEYPFGFGFELMNNPSALKLFLSLSDKRKAELMKRIATIESSEEMRGFLAGLVESSGRPPL